MGIAVFSFVAVFLMIASAGLLLFFRQTMLRRVSAVITPRTQQRRALKGAWQQTGLSVSGIMTFLERLLPKSEAEVSIVQKRLIRAGFRNDSAIKIFYGTKILVPAVL